MITSIALWLVGKGVPSQFARPLVWIVGALLLLGSVWGGWTLWLHHHDRSVIAQHESDVSNTVNEEVTAGTATADAADNAQAAQDAARANQVQEDIANAVAAHPKEAHASAGPATSAVLERLRHR
jgi:hypothetical protein